MNLPNSEQHLNQLRSNIDGDIRLNEAEKQGARTRAVDQFGHLSSNPDADDDIWNDHCEAARPMLVNDAELHANPPGAMVGNIWAVRAFEGSIGRQLSCNQREAERVVELCCMPEADRSEEERDELAEIYARIRLREGDECWLFDGPLLAQDPFEGVNLDSLSCRLGLPYHIGEEFVAFALAPPSNARRPCVLDVGWYFQQYWRPSGRTRPFCTSSSQDGLSEWIAKPPTITQTGGPKLRHIVADGNPVGVLPYDVA